MYDKLVNKYSASILKLTVKEGQMGELERGDARVGAREGPREGGSGSEDIGKDSREGGETKRGKDRRAGSQTDIRILMER